MIGSPAKTVSLSRTNGVNRVAAIAAVAALYFLAARLGLSLASVHTNVSPVWPPTGIAIASVLLLGYRAWPGVLIGAFFANLLTPIPVWAAGAIAAGNTLEAVSAGALLRAINFDNPLDRARDVFKFVLVTTLCTMISATIGNLSLGLSHAARWADFGSLWMTWWLGDLSGAVTIGPLLLTWGAGRDLWLPKRRYLEGVLLLVLLSLSAIVTFGKASPTPVQFFPLTRLIVPFLLWAAFRLGRRGVTAAIMVTSAFAVWGTAQGAGPFIGAAPNDSLLMLQFFLGSNAITFLFLGAVVEEKRRSEDRRRANERRLTANVAITRILAEAPTLTEAMPRILQTVGKSFGWELGVMWTLDVSGNVLRNVDVWRNSAQRGVEFEAVCRQRTFEKGVGLPGRVWANPRPAWIADVTQDDNFPRGPIAAAEDLHGAFAFPILFDQKFLGVMEFFSSEIREPDEAQLEMFEGVGNQIGQFIERKRAEEALEPASRLPAENPAPVMRLDTDRIVSYANPAAERILASWDLAVGKEAPAEIAEIATAALADGNKRELELPFGEQTYFLIFAPVIHSGYVNLYFTDITNLKQTQEALLRSEKELTEFFENATEAIHWVGPDGTILRANRAELRMLGYSADEYIGRKITEFHVIKAAINDILKRSKRGEALQGYAARLRHKNGSIRNVVINSNPYFENGEFIHTRCFTRDVTEQLQVEKTLRHLAAIVESTDDVVISKDLNGIIMSWNPAAEKLYGYKFEEVVGRPVSILIPPERNDEEPTILARLRRGERIDHYETVRMAKDGRHIHVSLTVSPIRDARGKIIGASKIARDISEQKRAQEEIARLLARERAARQDAEVANRAKDEFLAVLSHELRTPLTAMLGWLSILRGHKLDKQTTEHAIDTIERNAKAQAQLIEDLVDVSRIVGGKLNLELRPLDLLPVINAAVEVVRPAAAAKDIKLEINYDSTVGVVSGDAVRLQQVIWNLLANAVKFTPKGGSIYVDFRRAGSSAEVIIRDTGVGISADFLPHAFERFRQAESPVTRSHRGMGLGLAIVRHLVELHGGTVSAESEGENKGSTFSIRLPVADVNPPPIMAAETLGRAIEAGILNGIKVLLVEDEPDARELIALALRQSGAAVEAVDSAGNALDRMMRFNPDVLLSDIGLPVQSGYDLIRHIRAMPTTLNKVPAVALTAFASENDRQLSLAAGFHAHLAKPVDPKHLVEVIRSLVSNGKQGGNGQS